jgi:hypothetical protein
VPITTKVVSEITEKCDVYSLALSILFIYVRGHVLIKHVTQGNQNMVGRETSSLKYVAPPKSASLIIWCPEESSRKIIFSAEKSNSAHKKMCASFYLKKERKFCAVNFDDT